MKFGLNLYSLRTFLKDEGGIKELFYKLKEMGYDYVQYSGAATDAEILKRAVKETGMPIVLTHSSPDRILGDTDRLIDEHLSYGCKDIGIGSMPAKYRSRAGGAKDFIRDFEAAKEKIVGAGLGFHYHNHAFEFVKYDGVRQMDVLIDDAPDMGIILDTFWVQKGGASIAEYVGKLKNRIKFVHLKDFVATEEGDRMGYVGEGNINFPALVKEMKDCGTEYFLVEQDDAVDYPDPLNVIKKSADYLKEIKL